MVDIRTIRGKDKTDAFAKAKVEYGNNFVILTSKDIKVGGLFGLGQKTEHELRIMLNNSIYDRRSSEPKEEKKSYVDDSIDDNYEDKLISDRIEIKKHTTETIDAREMADRIVAVTNAIKNANRNNHNKQVENETRKTENTLREEEILNEDLINNKSEVKKDFTPLSSFPQYDNNARNDFEESHFSNLRSSLLEDSRNKYSQDYIDNNVKRIVQEQLKDIVKEYLDNSIPNINRNNFEYGPSYNYRNNIDVNRRHYNRDRGMYESHYYNNNTLHNNSEDNYRSSFNELKELREEGRHSYTNRYYERNKLEQNNTSSEQTDAMEEVFQYLRTREFPEEVLLDIREYLLKSSNARFVQSREIIKEEIDRYFSSKLQLSNGIEIGTKKKIVVFVGPTGVGKTTTIPKIAAQYIKSGKKVSFVTIDNYRIAAVDQLQRYASIMKVPFASASTPESLRAEIRKMDTSSLLFIDTMGRSPKSADEILAVSKYITTVGRFDMDIQLVMSATAKYQDAVKIMNAFKPTNYKGIILTKADETDYLSSSICAITRGKVPITYVTHGQGVPKDISTAKKYSSSIMQGLYGNFR